MAAANLLALLDDITTLLDDVALLGRAAAQKTAGVLGDDLALNAQQVAGIAAEREIPVVLAVAKGSLRNKAILVPAALFISALAPWAILPLLMLGGLFLCFEGFEKIAHRWLHTPQEDLSRHDELQRHLADTTVDMATLEAERVQGAIRTDFVLSAEIVTITLGMQGLETVSLVTRFGVLAGVAVLMTVGVYGMVAAIVKLDDLGLFLARRPGQGALVRALRRLGAGLVGAAPWLMQALAIAGTVAMFLVGGGIVLHGWPALHHLLQHAILPLDGTAANMLLDGLAGVLAGALALAVVTLVQRLRGR
jgi:predicted DNA repair protein MutK